MQVTKYLIYLTAIEYFTLLPQMNSHTMEHVQAHSGQLLPVQRKRHVCNASSMKPPVNSNQNKLDR